MFNLSGKVAIVTGASRGIGRGIAEVLAARGAQVIAGARGEHAAGTVDAIRQAGGHAEAASIDVTDGASIEAMVEGVLARHGRIDVLVNNAGITRDGAFHKMTQEQWNSVINTNLGSLFNVTRQVIEGMRSRKFGRIVNISSVNGQKGQFGQVFMKPSENWISPLRASS